jgi:hypothetical protein
MKALVRNRHRNRRAIAVRLALIAALVMAAFAHRPAAPTPTGVSALEMAQYVLPDGSLPVLCLPGEDGGISGSLCEFCLIAGGAAPPGPGAFLPAMRLRAETGPPLVARTGPPIATAHLKTAPLRGPPSVA